MDTELGMDRTLDKTCAGSHSAAQEGPNQLKLIPVNKYHTLFRKAQNYRNGDVSVKTHSHSWGEQERTPLFPLVGTECEIELTILFRWTVNFICQKTR